MAYINTIQPNKATGAVHDLYMHQEDHWGYIPNYAKVFSYRPETMTRWGRLLAEIRRSVDDYRFELVTLVVALELKHPSCSLAHGKKLAAIVGAGSVQAIARGDYSGTLSAADKAIVDYARQIARDANAVTEQQVRELKTRHGLTDADIFDIAAIAAGRCFFTKILDAVGTEVDAGLLAIEEELRDSLLASVAA